MDLLFRYLGWGLRFFVLQIVLEVCLITLLSRPGLPFGSVYTAAAGPLWHSLLSYLWFRTAMSICPYLILFVAICSYRNKMPVVSMSLLNGAINGFYPIEYAVFLGTPDRSVWTVFAASISASAMLLLFFRRRRKPVNAG